MGMGVLIHARLERIHDQGGGGGGGQIPVLTAQCRGRTPISAWGWAPRFSTVLGCDDEEVPCLRR